MSTNYAIRLLYKGYIDTWENFSSFFDKDHTVMAWFMPEFPYCHTGPMVAENGTGNYAFGQGDYSSGNVYKDTSDKWHKGDPVLFAQVGNKIARYLAPEVKRGDWYHIALRRKSYVASPPVGPQVRFELFLNGFHKKPVIINKQVQPPQITPTNEIIYTMFQNIPSKPTGTLRFGRRTSGSENSMQKWQAYGLLDDVAIFDRALEENQIKTIVNQRRLNGQEQGLQAAWCFDILPGNGPHRRSILESHWEPSEQRHKGSFGKEIKTIVQHEKSSNRDNSSDGKEFENSVMGVSGGFAAARSEKLLLPFAQNEVWKVNYGYDDPAGSHHGYASFCFDFAIAKPGEATKEYPNGTDNAPVYNCRFPGEGSHLFNYRNQADPANSPREGNYARITISDDEFLMYLHLAENSLNAKFTGGTPMLDSSGNTIGFQIPENNPISVEPTEQIGKVGPKASHLHFDGGGFEGNTHPVTFINYEVSHDGGQTWQQVLYGYPRQNEWIRRPLP